MPVFRLIFYRPMSTITALLLVFGIFLPTEPAQAADGSISLAAYRQIIEDSLDLIDTLWTEEDEVSAAALTELAEVWRNVVEVELPDSEHIPVDTKYLVTLLNTSPPDLSSLQAHLAALQALAESWPDNIFTNEDILPLEKILLQPEYQWPEQQEDLGDSLIDRFLDWFFGLFPDSWSFGGGAINLGWLYYPISAVFIAALLYYIFKGTIGSLVSEESLGGTDGQGEENMTSDGAIRQAQQLSSRGDNRVAVRYLYLAALLLLEEKGLLHYDRTKTNQEYVRDLSGQPGLLKPLQRVVNVFDRVWYGFREIDDEAYTEYEQEVERLRKQS